MRRQGFNLRWIVLFCFVVFALLFAGSLLTDRFKTSDGELISSSPSIAPSTSTASAPVVEAKGSPTAASSAVASPTSRPSLSPTPAGTTTTPQATKIDLLYPVNKQTALPSSYVPDDLVALTSVRVTTANQRLRRLVVPYLEKLVADAKAAGYELVVSSTYRSYSEQESVHAYWQKQLGKVEADRVSALAGHSEHQLGTTVDLTSAGVGYELEEKFGTTPEGRWLRDNAYRYGFVISYPSGKEALTGYAYEPWHIRYVGAEHAAAIYQKGITLEEYLRTLR